MKNPFIHAINFITLVTIFVNFYELQRPLGVILNLPSSNIISITTIFICLVFLIVNRKIAYKLIGSKIYKTWCLLIIVFPSILFFIQFFQDFLDESHLIYWLTFNFLFGLMFIASSILMKIYSIKLLKQLIFLSLIVAVFGFIINLINYSFIVKVLEFTGNEIAKNSQLFRPIGFYQHPNAAAFSILLTYVFLLTFTDFKSLSYLKITLLTLFVSLLILITFSRTSLMILLIVFIFFTIKYLNKSNEIKFNVNRSSSRILTFVYFLPFLFLMTLITPILLEFIQEYTTAGLNDRLLKILKSGENMKSDESVELRMKIIPTYLRDTSNNFLFGSGPEFIIDKLNSGKYSNISQNAFIENLVKFGFPYTLYFFIVLFKTVTFGYKQLKNKDMNDALFVFIICLLFLSFSVIDIFYYRAIVILLGFILSYSINHITKEINVR